MGISTHILDTSLGRPAAGVSITLSRQQDESWIELDHGKTDADGRCKSLLAGTPLTAATYKLQFATSEYFTAQRIETLYPFVDIVFTVGDPTQNFHIPLLLAANGYTTYRGS